MGIIRKATVTLFAMWVGMGFLVGLTGSVISAPKYYRPVDNAAPLVYNTGLGPQGKIVVQASASGSSIARPEEIFTTKACIQCHRVSYFGIKGGETGPDLSIAYTDVPNRFGRTLEDFLAEPEGTMGAIIPDRLTDDDKSLVLELLVEAAGLDGAETPSQDGEMDHLPDGDVSPVDRGETEEELDSQVGETPEEL